MDNIMSRPYTQPTNAATLWGSQLFENGNDFAVLAKFNREAGLKKLQDEANADITHPPVHYSLWAPDCSGPDAVKTVREHLDSGVLAKLAANQIKAFFNPIKKEECTFNGWTCTLLAACAISLGCKTFDDLPGYKMVFGTYKAMVEGCYKAAFMHTAAVTQFQKALKTYQRGTPYHFGSKTIEQDRDEKLAKGWTNAQATPCLIPCVGGLPMSSVDERKDKVRLGAKVMSMIGPCTKEDMQYVDGQCGTCGNKDAKLKCGKCKDQLYCNVQCQKKDWDKHKVCCRTPEDRHYMMDNALFMNTYFGGMFG